MSGKFVRASKYRHVFGQASKKELQYENVRVTSNAWDSNIIKTNGKYISINWNASGGGAFAVIPVSEVGKSPDQVPLFRGHTAQVLDTDFDPFNDNRIASAAEDSKIVIWDIPSDYSFHNYLDDDNQPKNISPTKILSGHTRKVGHVLFHPVAKNILASSSLDYTVKIWNVETGETLITLKHPDMVTSMSFSYDGNHLATVSRDKKLRVWDIRKGEVVSEGPAHTGAKNQRVVWLGNSDRLATTGFSRLSDRQIGVWDAFNLEKGDLGGFYSVDQSSGILMPFYDDGNKILYIAGKGDGNIRYFEFQNDELFELSEFQSTEPQRGFAIVPKRTVNVRDNEVLKCFKTVVDQFIVPISFHVPRRAEEFQDDIYPAAPSARAALTAEEWFSGKSVEGPLLIDMRDVYESNELKYQHSKKPESTAALSKESTPEPVKNIENIENIEKAASPVTSETSTPKPVANISDMLNTNDSVDKLLAKSSKLDAVNDAEDPSKGSSDWEEEDVKSTPVVKTKKEEPKKEITSSLADAVETLSTPSATKSMGLKQSVEKLSSLVLYLEDVVLKLTDSNLEKDERLKKLEHKIEKLLKKE